MVKRKRCIKFLMLLNKMMHTYGLIYLRLQYLTFILVNRLSLWRLVVKCSIFRNHLRFEFAFSFDNLKNWGFSTSYHTILVFCWLFNAKKWFRLLVFDLLSLLSELQVCPLSFLKVSLLLILLKHAPSLSEFFNKSFWRRFVSFFFLKKISLL